MVCQLGQKYWGYQTHFTEIQRACWPELQRGKFRMVIEGGLGSLLQSGGDQTEERLGLWLQLLLVMQHISGKKGILTQASGSNCF